MNKFGNLLFDMNSTVRAVHTLDVKFPGVRFIHIAVLNICLAAINQAGEEESLSNVRLGLANNP